MAAYFLGVLAVLAIALNLAKLPPGRRRYLVVVGIKLSLAAKVASAIWPLLFVELVFFIAATQNGGSKDDAPF